MDTKDKILSALVAAGTIVLGKKYYDKMKRRHQLMKNLGIEDKDKSIVGKIEKLKENPDFQVSKILHGEDINSAISAYAAHKKG